MITESTLAEGYGTPALVPNPSMVERLDTDTARAASFQWSDMNGLLHLKMFTELLGERDRLIVPAAVNRVDHERI